MIFGSIACKKKQPHTLSSMPFQIHMLHFTNLPSLLPSLTPPNITFNKMSPCYYRVLIPFPSQFFLVSKHVLFISHFIPIFYFCLIPSPSACSPIFHFPPSSPERDEIHHQYFNKSRLKNKQRLNTFSLGMYDFVASLYLGIPSGRRLVNGAPVSSRKRHKAMAKTPMHEKSRV